MGLRETGRGVAFGLVLLLAVSVEARLCSHRARTHPLLRQDRLGSRILSDRGESLPDILEIAEEFGSSRTGLSGGICGL